MSSTVKPLRVYLRSLSGWAWNKQGHAYRYGRGLCLQEETITEMLLLRLALDSKRYGIRVRMYNKRQEKKIGADWDWVIKTNHCRHRLRVQAKRLYHSSTGADYGGLSLRNSQHSRLISRARKKRRTPVYVFYNHDFGLRSHLFTPQASSEFRGRSHWGCGISHAKHVQSNSLVDLISNMKPWHDLICVNGDCGMPLDDPDSPEAGRDQVGDDLQDDWPSFFDDREKIEAYLAQEELNGVAEIDLTDFHRAAEVRR